MRKVHLISGLAVFLAASAAHAAVLTTSASAPASAAISQPDFSAPAFDGGKDFTDNAGPPGQTFTPGTGMTLNAVTVKGFANNGASFGGPISGGTWTITISRVDAGPTLTQLDQETANPAAVTDGSAYVTIALANPVPLTGGTKYAYDIFSSQGYFAFAKSSTNIYAGGEAMQHGSTSRAAANGAVETNLQSVDRTFFISATVPEPGSLMLLGLGALSTMLRRRERLKEASHGMD